MEAKLGEIHEKDIERFRRISGILQLKDRMVFGSYRVGRTGSLSAFVQYACGPNRSSRTISREKFTNTAGRSL